MSDYRSYYLNRTVAVHQIVDLLEDFFNHDFNKVKAWFYMPNPMLGNVTPRSMILAAKQDKLLKLVRSMLNENVRSNENVRVLHQ
jgi:hypothetical protein